MTASRLYRRLNPAGTYGSIFELHSESLGTLTDADLISVTVTRGADQPFPGLAPSVLEFQLPGARWPQTNTGVSFQLRDSFALAHDLPLTRAIGRVGTFDTDDRGGDRFTTTAQAAHWSSLLLNASRKVQPTAGQAVADLVRRAVEHPELSNRFGAILAGVADDTIHSTLDWMPTREALDTYATATGMQLRELRAGNIELVSLTRRAYEAEQSRVGDLPILRRQGIAPATWTQDVDAANTQYLVDRRTSEGVPYVQTWPLPAGAPVTVLEQSTLDWSTITPATENYVMYANARNYASNLPENRLSSIRLDLAHLLTSPEQYDRNVAVQAIRYEVGAHVMLGGDWPAAVRGRYFANQIREHISPAGWEMELSLQPASRVIGLSYDDSQNVPVYTWAQLNGTWAGAAGSWSSYAPQNA